MAKIRANQETAEEMIESSMRLIGALVQGRSAAARELAAGIVTLNDMIESWNIQRLFIYEVSREIFTLKSKNPHTIGLATEGGADGDLVIAWPPKIESASILPGEPDGTEYPVEILSKEEYQDRSPKDTTGTFSYELWHERSWPLAKIWLYPVPAAGLKLVLNLWKQLDSGLELDTRLSVPPGYLRAIRFNLAVEIASEWGLDPKRNVERIAREAKAAIGNLNSLEPSYMKPDASLLGIGSRGFGYNIRSGNYQ